MSQDLFIVAIGLSGFSFFLAIHFCSFRFLKPEHILKAIMLIFLIAFVATAGIALYLFGLNDWFYILLSLFIYGSFTFFYVLCIYGPYETSIRMRLIRELAKNNEGKTLEAILGVYNENIILGNRLKRLVGAGDLIFKDNKYYNHKKQNVFFVLDKGAAFLHAFIHSR